MIGKNIAVFGIYSTRPEVQSAVSLLKERGFRHTDISCLMPENEGSKDIGTEKSTKSPEGAVVGGATGALVGTALGWLAGIGSLAIPGIGPFIAAGPIMVALAGTGAGAALGGLTGALVGFGIPEYEAKRYEGIVREGRILLSVHCDDSEWAKKARDILEATGADGISQSKESTDNVIKGTESDRPMSRPATGMRDDSLGGVSL